jgi:hypothetical protein
VAKLVKNAAVVDETAKGKTTSRLAIGLTKQNGKAFRQLEAVTMPGVQIDVASPGAANSADGSPPRRSLICRLQRLRQRLLPPVEPAAVVDSARHQQIRVLDAQQPPAIGRLHRTPSMPFTRWRLSRPISPMIANFDLALNWPPAC